MRLGYIRTDQAGPTRQEQEDALRAAGITDFTTDAFVYVDLAPNRRSKPSADPHPARTSLVAALRSGDEVAIHSPPRLGTTRDDVLRLLAEIGRKGASVYDCSAGEVVRFHPDAAVCIAFADRAEMLGKQERAARARRSITHRGAPPKVLRGKRLEQAKALWSQTETSVEKIADMLGVAPRTLYREFGPRGIPRFGRKS